MRPFGVRWCDPLRAAAGKPVTSTWNHLGMPKLGQDLPIPITCHFCAMQRDLMCIATYVTLEHTHFCPQSSVRGAPAGAKKRPFRVKSVASGRFWGHFRAISEPGNQRRACQWRGAMPHGQRAPLREYIASVRLVFAGARAAWRHAVRSSRRPVRPASARLPGIGNRSTPFRVAAHKRRGTRPRARLRLARHSGSRPRRGRGPVVRRARY